MWKTLLLCVLVAVVAAQKKKDEEPQKRYGNRPHGGGGLTHSGVAAVGGFSGRPNRPGFGGQPHGSGFGGLPHGNVGVGNVHGGFHGSSQGGFPGNVHGGFPGNVQGGFPGNVHGGFPGNVHGGFPGGASHTGGAQIANVGGQVGVVYPQTSVGGVLTNDDLQYNCAATASSSQFHVNQVCKKFCKAPVTYFGGVYLCCEDRLVGVCPKVRSQCPGIRGLGPVCCFTDSQCQKPTQKCCFDTCLQHKVCKEAVSYG